jgi:hypothetical protein
MATAALGGLGARGGLPTRERRYEASRRVARPSAVPEDLRVVWSGDNAPYPRPGVVTLLYPADAGAEPAPEENPELAKTHRSEPPGARENHSEWVGHPGGMNAAVRRPRTSWSNPWIESHRVA